MRHRLRGSVCGGGLVRGLARPRRWPTVPPAALESGTAEATLESDAAAVAPAARAVRAFLRGGAGIGGSTGACPAGTTASAAASIGAGPRARKYTVPIATSSAAPAPRSIGAREAPSPSPRRLRHVGMPGATREHAGTGRPRWEHGRGRGDALRSIDIRSGGADPFRERARREEAFARVWWTEPA